MSPAPLVSTACTLCAGISTSAVPSNVSAPSLPRVMTKVSAIAFSRSTATSRLSLWAQPRASSSLQKTRFRRSPIISVMPSRKNSTIPGSEKLRAVFTPAASAISLALIAAARPVGDVTRYPSRYTYSEAAIAPASSCSIDRVSLMPRKVFILRSASGVINTKHLPVVPAARSPFRQWSTPAASRSAM